MTIAFNPHEPVFYVYALLDIRKPGEFKYGKFTFEYEPFYIGKGKGSRTSAHYLRSNKLVKNKISKILRETGESHVVVMLKHKMTEDTAYLLEEQAINTVGRKDQGKGPLLNLVNGGRGKQQMYQSKATKRRRASTVTAHWDSMTPAEYKERTKNMGGCWSEESRINAAKRKQELFASKAGDEVRAKIREARERQTQFYNDNPELKAALYAKQAATRNRNKDLISWCSLMLGIKLSTSELGSANKMIRIKLCESYK